MEANLCIIPLIKTAMETTSLGLEKKCLTPVEHLKDTEILTKGNHPDFVYILLKGSVRLSTLSKNGHIISYNTIEAGDYFGWMSMLDNKPRQTHAVTIEDSELIKIKLEDFKKILLTDEAILDNFLKRVGGTLRDYTDRIENLSTLTSKERIINELKERFKVSDTIKISNHEDFSTWTGTARETVSRTLKQLEKDGYISKKGNHYTLLQDL